MMVTLKEGLQLKQWVLGKKLGSGACSDVYVATSKNGESYAMKISPIPVIPPSKLKNKKRKKTPEERNADALYAEHLLYQSTIMGHSGLPALPYGAYGEDKGYRFLVMQLLGRNLEQVVKESGPVPEATVARLGLEILDIFRHLHSKKIIFVDVKPENFMLERTTENKVYCVDFGLAERYILVTGCHKEYREGPIVGTPTYLSLNCHGGITCSRRDDVESLLNVLLYLARGDLPWQGAKSDEEGHKIKKSTSLAILCTGLSNQWMKMMAIIRGCAFDEEPNYAGIEKLLKAVGGEPSTSVYDWGKAAASSKKLIQTKSSKKTPQLTSSKIKDTSSIAVKMAASKKRPVIQMSDVEEISEMRREPSPKKTTSRTPLAHNGPAAKAAQRAVAASAKAKAAAKTALGTSSPIRRSVRLSKR